MIHVPRSRVPVPYVLDGPTSAAANERRENEKRLKASPPEELQFTVYKHPSVGEALRKLFANKCAYCERKYMPHPSEIEHFRPKGEVRQSRNAAAEAGYWWLAADWNNLLLSCIDCNRARYHDVHIGGVTHRALRGKENLFPLHGAVVTPRIPGCESTETALLLDPCRDDPSLALEWADNGVVEPRKDAAGTPNPKGVHSIECFGLDSNDLFMDRRDHAIRVMVVIVELKELEDDLRDAIQDFATHATPKHEDRVNRLIDRVQRKIVELRQFAAPDQRFSAMATALIERHYQPPTPP